jgi:ketosteroid isomerase-like protein
MSAMDIVTAWDRSLRVGDWEGARALLADDATYTAPDWPEDQRINCETPEEIIDLLRSWKGKVPDVEVVEWEPMGDRVLARLRQPAWGDDRDWFQVLTVRDGLIAAMEDYRGRESAFSAATGGA